MTKTKLFLGLFFIVSIVELLAVSAGWREVHVVAKSLIMLSLIGYYMGAAENRNRHLIRAMFFCWAGDVLLLRQNDDENFFILGLLAFLIGHLLYIYAYRQLQWRNPGPIPFHTKLLTASPIYVLAILLIWYLYPGLGTLAVPVMVYALVLAVMVQTGIFRMGRTSPDSFWFVNAGAALFMLSDSLLGINKFSTPFTGAAGIVMLTYILGQYLIVEGAVRHR